MSDEMIEIPKVFVVTNLDDFTTANEWLTTLKGKLKEVDADEKNITAPINKSLKEIRDKYRPVKDRLEQGITILRNALNAYKRIEDAKREQDRLALEDLAKDGSASLDDLISLADEAPSLGGRLTTTVEADPALMTVEYKLDLLARVWDAAMVIVRKDVAVGRVEAGVTVTKEKKI